MKFSACDAPTIALRRARGLGFLAHLSARERRVWEAYRGADGTRYLCFAPDGGPALWMREEEERPAAREIAGDVFGDVAGGIGLTRPALVAPRAPRPASRTVIVGRYGKRELFVYAGARAR